MNKIKNLKKKIEKLPFYRVGWVIMLVEFLVWGTNLVLFLTTSPALLFLGNAKLFPVASALSFLLLKQYTISNSVVLLILSFLPFVLKMICAIGIANKKRVFSIACVVLYLLDFIGFLIYWVNGELRLDELLTTEILRIVCSIFFIGAGVSASFISVYFLFYSEAVLSKREKKKVKIITFSYSLVLVAIGVAVFTGVYINESKTTATKEEIELVNKCYAYTEKYLQNELPDDKETLETMQKDIEAVIETDIFKNAVHKSKFHERHMKAKVDKDYFYTGAVPEKSMYANELMYLKGKILLKLDKDDEYIDYYIDTYKYFTTSLSQKYYFEYLNNDKENYSEDDCEVIRKGCIKLLESDLPDYEKWECTADYSIINPQNTTKEKREGERDKLRAEYVAGYTSEKFSKDLDKYETIERSLYMLQ